MSWRMGVKSDQEYTFGMRKITLCLLFLMTSSFGFAQDQPVRALMTIQGLTLRTSENNQKIPSIAGNEEVSSTMKLLKDGDEVMIEGRIHQETITYGESSRINSYLIIDKIHKVSLAELGNIKFQIPESTLSFESRPYSPVAIPVTAEVATAMTMTTSMLLLQDLSSSGNTDPQGRQQIRQSIMLSAGLMATIIFLYEQINGSTKP